MLRAFKLRTASSIGSCEGASPTIAGRTHEAHTRLKRCGRSVQGLMSSRDPFDTGSITERSTGMHLGLSLQLVILSDHNLSSLNNVGVREAEHENKSKPLLFVSTVGKLYFLYQWTGVLNLKIWLTTIRGQHRCTS